MAVALAELLERERLFDEILRRPAWMADALCLEHPEVTWFPRPGVPHDDAKAVCAVCLCRDDCLRYALTADVELVGVWAGTSVRERRRLRRRVA